VAVVPVNACHRRTRDIDVKGIQLDPQARLPGRFGSDKGGAAPHEGVVDGLLAGTVVQHGPAHALDRLLGPMGGFGVLPAAWDAPERGLLAVPGPVDQSSRVGKVRNDGQADWEAAWGLFPGSIAYVWHGALHATTVAESLVRHGFTIRAQIFWAKERLVIGRGDYHWQHEPLSQNLAAATAANDPVSNAAIQSQVDGLVTET
jgi:hypothetical protein